MIDLLMVYDIIFFVFEKITAKRVKLENIIKRGHRTKLSLELRKAESPSRR